MQAGEQLLRAWFEEVWNKGRREAIAEMVHPNFLLHDGDATYEGSTGFEGFYDQIGSAFSNSHIAVDDVFEAGDKVCARWTAEVTHTGPGMGVAPTGRGIRVTGITVARFENGKFIEAWQSWDGLKAMTEIGALVRAAGA